MNTRLPPDFKEFLQLLNDHQVEYLLIGGYAVGYHGYPRATGDMDIWIAVSPDNADKLVAVLNAFGFGSRSSYVNADHYPHPLRRTARYPAARALRHRQRRAGYR